MADKKESVGAIWQKTTRNGKTLLSITIDGKRYTAWPNDYKKTDKEPDFRVFVDDYEKPVQHQHTGGMPFKREDKRQEPADDINSGDDLPF